jgi:hypothetical protein
MGTLEGSQADVLLEGSQAVVPLFSGLVRDLWSVKREGFSRIGIFTRRRLTRILVDRMS